MLRNVHEVYTCKYHGIINIDIYIIYIYSLYIYITMSVVSDPESHVAHRVTSIYRLPCLYTHA